MSRMKWLIDLNYIELPAIAGMGLIRPLRDKISPRGSVHAIKPSIAHAF